MTDSECVLLFAVCVVTMLLVQDEAVAGDLYLHASLYQHDAQGLCS